MIISVVNKNESGFPPDSPQHLFLGSAKETLRVEEKGINVVASINDLMVFDYLLKVTRLDGIFNSLLLCIHEEKPS